MSTVFASVVVPTYNGAEVLPRVLAGLESQAEARSFEIIVVDDGGTDHTPRLLSEWAKLDSERRLSIRQENAGPARARNRGARMARGEYVLFLDDDCVPEARWLHVMLATLEETGAAAVAGAVMNPEDDWVGRYINREAVISQVLSPDGDVAELITGNAGVASRVFSALGGFDEAIRVAGGEDTEFSLRLRKAGHRIVHAGAARVFHDSRVDLRGYLKMIYRHGRGRRRLGEVHEEHRIRLPLLRLLWLLWPVRAWVGRDYLRYRRAGVPAGEALRYLGLRYGENLARVAGFLRGT